MRLAIVLMAVAAFPGVGEAQEFEPRTYVVVPPGLNFVGVA